jgi:hypothetical protein
MEEELQCIGLTKKGERCKLKCKEDKYCKLHKNQNIMEEDNMEEEVDNMEEEVDNMEEEVDNMEEEVDNTLAGWLSFAMRKTMNDEEVRNEVLKDYILNMENITIGKTFTDLYNTKQIDRYIFPYLDNIIKLNGKVLFSASNLVDSQYGETHFQTYILDNDNKILHMLDPAMKPTGEMGIYHPFITLEEIAPYIKKKGYKTRWVIPTNTCQVNDRDVFCQTWSLWLLINSIIDPYQKSPVPKSEKERYILLLKFLQSTLLIDNVCKKFRKIFNKEIDIFRNDKDYPIYEEDYVNFKKIDPCVEFLKLKGTDLM